MKKVLIVIISLVVIALAGCVRQPSYSIIPAITFQSVSSTALYTNGGTLTDTVVIHFTDGDGDIGPGQGQTDTNGFINCTDHSLDSGLIANPVYNVYYYFYRSGDSCLEYVQTPYIDNNAKYNAISGLIQFYPQVECAPSGGTDTVFFSVFIKDRAGHVSNRVWTPKIVVYCH